MEAWRELKKGLRQSGVSILAASAGLDAQSDLKEFAQTQDSSSPDPDQKVNHEGKTDVFLLLNQHSFATMKTRIEEYKPPPQRLAFPPPLSSLPS